MFSERSFEGKIVFVTGGGSGIGFTIAQRFLELGATVYIASRKPERIEKALTELKQYGNVIGTTLDIREDSQVEEVAKRIKDENGRLDILINNAGGQFPTAAEMMSINGWRAVINNNLNGTFIVTQIMAKSFFIPQKEGNIVNIIANVYRGFPGMAHTGAARAGVDNLTKSLAVEWSRFGIRINAIAPGVIQSSGLDQYPPSFLKDMNKKIPMKRMGSMDEVAWPVLFFASDLSSYVTGETLYVDGGNRLWGDIWEM